MAKRTAFYRFFVRLSKVSGLWKPATLARNCRKSPAQTAEIPVFVETIGGDWFDRHWTVGMAVNLDRFKPLDHDGPCDGCSSCRSGQRDIEFAKSILSKDCSIGWRGKVSQGAVVMRQRIRIEG